MAQTNKDSTRNVVPASAKSRNGNHALGSDTAPRGWSASHGKEEILKKNVMASHFVEHDFLVPRGERPDKMAARKRAALILVGPGTTPNQVVDKCCWWMKEHWGNQPFNVTWYTPGTLVAGTIRDFRDKNYALVSCVDLFLFPGRVHSDVQSVFSKIPVEFAEKLADETTFTYSFLGAYSLDLLTGSTYFHFSDEVDIQRACAELRANEKYLFVDPSKFRCEGVRGYDIRGLLKSSQAVTIYTTASENDQRIVGMFKGLAEHLIVPLKDQKQALRDWRADWPDVASKCFRLCIVPFENRESTDILIVGTLKETG